MTARLKLPLMLALICGLLLALAPSGAYAGKGMEVAVQDDAAMVNEIAKPGTRQKGLKLATGLNASWIRANVVWSYVTGRTAKKKKEPKKITYNWTGYDALIDSAAARGIHVELSLTGPAPAYATGNHKVGPDRVKASPFKRFAKAAAQHFGSRVTRYSIWNEPNYRGWLSPISKQAKLYRALYTSGYSAIKAANPTAQVLIGETSPYSTGRNAQAPLQFLRGVTCANANYKRAKKCTTLKTDGYAHHPYDFRHKVTYKYPGKDNVTLATLSRLTTALTKLKRAKLLTTPSGGAPYVYLTEYGYFASGKYKTSESKRGKYLVQAFNLALKNSRVKQMLQFVLIRPPSKYRFFDTSLASASGKPGSAYKKLAAWAKKAAAGRRIARAGD
ncbi:MAG: hypothetical protein QOJ29_4741 [Thermoleophilaceae bacterium]|nr:hypothetical protein [Thermoleophilaceae bacterium]